MNLIQVMIVDDEPEIRTGIVMKVDWSSLGMNVQYEASNGQEALAFLEQTPVDIVITDMYMPMMDGVELLKNCSEYYPQIKLIVLTGYDEFLYAKAAIRHRVKDYLLKPVIRTELIETLKKVKQELSEEIQLNSDRSQLEWQLSQYLKSMREQFILLTIKDTADYAWLWNDQSKRLRLEHWNERLVRFITIVIHSNEDPEAESMESFRLPFEMLCREIAEGWEQEILIFRDPSFPFMMHIIIEENESFDGLISQMRATIQQYLKFRMVFGIGHPVAGFNEWKRGYLSAIFDWNENKTNNLNARANKSDIETAITPEMEKLLVYLLKSDKKEAFKKQIKKLIDAAEQHSPEVLVRTIFYIYFVMETTAQAYGISLSSEQHIWLQPDRVWNLNDANKAEAYLVEILDSISHQITAVNESPDGVLFDSVKRFIHENYTNDLNLSMLAERYHFNASYFSELFRAQIGQSFSDYLIEVRMNKVSELLIESELPLSDIAELTGYSNPSYFSTAFKKKFNISPSEYRNQKTNKFKSV